MKNSEWLDAQSACALLGVKPQTLYAYVSRHKIRASADPQDPRRSLYTRQDIEELIRKMRRPRARAEVAEGAIRWGDPVLATAISEVRDGTIWLRGRRIQDCAANMTHEEVAAHLCGLEKIVCPATAVNVTGQSSFARAMKALASQTDSAAPMLGRDLSNIAIDAERAMSVIANACLGDSKDGQIHRRIGAVWGVETQSQDIIRRALVLLSDHELNPSTFAVRVSASTGTSLSAALLAGMATLSGPRHGGVASLAKAALDATMKGSLDNFLAEHAQQDPYTYGFGHPLYPDGDPRATELLKQIPFDAPVRSAVEILSERLLLPPNIDAALAASVVHFNWPSDAATVLFSIGRASGWIAHAIEQISGGEMIRPRAKYQSLSLEELS